MYRIPLYHAVYIFFAKVYYFLKSVYLSNYFWVLFFLNFWIDSPRWYKLFFYYTVKEILKRPFSWVFYADRSQTLYFRWLLKRKEKIYIIWLAIHEAYVLFIVAWRDIMDYWRYETPWKLVWLSGTFGWLYFYLSNYWLIYNEYRLKRLYYINGYVEGQALLKCFHKRFHDFRLFRYINAMKYKNFFMGEFYSPNPTTYEGILRHIRGYYIRKHYMHSIWFTNYHFFWNNQFYIYFLFTTLYWGVLYYYNIELFPYLRSLFYFGYDDYVRIEDDWGDIEWDNILYHKWICQVYWLHYIYLAIPIEYYFNCTKESKGRIYDYNNAFIMYQHFRRIYWLNYRLIIYKNGNYQIPQQYYERPTEKEMQEFQQNLQNENSLWYKKWNKRRLKNNWPLKNIINLWNIYIWSRN